MTENENSPENLLKFLMSNDPALIRMGLSMIKNIEIPKEIFPHLCILTFDTGSNVHDEIRDDAESIAWDNDIPEYGDRDTDFWRNGNADLIIKQLEQTEDLWGWFRELPDENGYYDLNEVIEKFPWRSDAFSDGGERAEELLRGILNGDVVDLKRRWRKEIELDHGLILQANAEEALVKLGKIDPEDCIWRNEWSEFEEE